MQIAGKNLESDYKEKSLWPICHSIVEAHIVQLTLVYSNNCSPAVMFSKLSQFLLKLFVSFCLFPDSRGWRKLKSSDNIVIMHYGK